MLLPRRLRRWAPRAILLGICVAAGCRNDRSSRSPVSDATHLPRLGRTDSFGRAGDGAATTTVDELDADFVRQAVAPAELERGLKREVDHVQALVELWWATRRMHEKVDAVDVPATFAPMRRGVETLNMKVKGRERYAVLLRDTLCHLRDAHLRVVGGPDVPKTWQSGLRFVRVGADVVATGSRPEGADKPRPGDRLVEVDGKPVAEYLREVCLQPGSTAAQRERRALQSLSRQRRFSVEKPAPAQLTLVGSDDARYELPVRWTSADGQPAMSCVSSEVIDRKRGIGLLTLRTFWCGDQRGQLDEAKFEAQLKAAVAEIRRSKHVIVDVRENEGGSDAAAKAAASALRGGRYAWMNYRHKTPYAKPDPYTTEVHQASSASPNVHQAKLWLLVGPGCFSTCEIFVDALRKTDRVKLVGQTTAGGVGNPQRFVLPYSGLVITIPITEYAFANTTTLIETKGIEPDVTVETSLSDVLRGEDPTLAKAKALAGG